MARRGRGSGHSNGAQSKSTKLRPGAPAGGGTGSFSFWKIGGSLAIATCLIAVTYHYFFAPEEVMRMSTIIRNHINPVLLSIDQKYQMDAFLLHDPLADVMKTKLRPVQERIASLRTQCAQYEQMERIPGGPTQFIQSSLHEIQNDILQRVLNFHEECLVILREWAAGGSAMAKAAVVSTESSALRLNENHLRFLIMEEVYLTPDEDTPAEVLQKAREEGLSLEQIVAIAEQLAKMYEKLEEAGLEAQGVGESEFGFKSLDALMKELDKVSDEVYNRMEPYLMKIAEMRKGIADFKKKYSKYMQLLHELQREKMKELHQGIGKLWENMASRQKPYIELYQGILKELQNLKIRIGNLKYSYAKRKGVD